MSYNCMNILKWTESQLKYTYDVSLQEATPQELHEALGQAVMMSIADNWSNSKRARLHERKAYYISAEYLIGRLVYSNLYNLGILDEMKQLFASRGVDLAVLEDIEDAALGNGGLGRLAACFLDSAASINIPLSGYGLRYKYGLFKQSFDAEGSQKEAADDWSKYGDPWSYRRYNHTVKVKFPDHTVLAVPYDVPVIGYGTNNINTLRLWQCEPETPWTSAPSTTRITSGLWRRRTRPRTSPGCCTPTTPPGRASGFASSSSMCCPPLPCRICCGPLRWPTAATCPTLPTSMPCS